MLIKKIEQLEAELLFGAHPTLVAAYNHAKNDMPESALPEIIEKFQLWKADWTDKAIDDDDIDLPEYEDLIKEGR
ncbi:hypothetical protein SDC9_15016 [bioreactor metagenome]|uniref:Uncharacterized protein n=1 Tax=bioreactor metagenome TaxID=1076179 RepID=A0A644TRL6_9ZZZZ